MTEAQAKKEFYQMNGYKPAWSDYVQQLVAQEDKEQWRYSMNPLPTLKPIKVEKRRKHYLSIILP